MGGNLFKKSYLDFLWVEFFMIEGVSQNLRMINGRFKITSGNFFGNYMNIFHKTKVQTVILRCKIGLNLNWLKRMTGKVWKTQCIMSGVAYKLLIRKASKLIVNENI